MKKEARPFPTYEIRQGRSPLIIPLFGLIFYMILILTQEILK